MKNLRIQQQFHFRRSEQMRTEALLLEKFSTSPRFTAIYGYCDTSLLVETAREFTDQVVPFDSPRQAERGRISRTDLAKLESDHSIYSFNNFTAEQKLDMASQIAEALAEFHGSESVIVHDDFDPDNFLITDSRQLKMNDMVCNMFLVEFFVYWL
jgi:serine/threonine protein kinase